MTTIKIGLDNYGPNEHISVETDDDHIIIDTTVEGIPFPELTTIDARVLAAVLLAQANLIQETKR